MRVWLLASAPHFPGQNRTPPKSISGFVLVSIQKRTPSKGNTGSLGNTLPQNTDPSEIQAAVVKNRVTPKWVALASGNMD